MDFSRPLAVITPTLDGPVLAVLSRADAAFTTGQLSRMLPDFSVQGIRKVLNRLVEQGVVTADQVGNAFAYRLNREHLAAEHIIALADLRAALFRRIEDCLAGWAVPPVYAAVFGSVARGDSTARSDIDLLLVQPDDADDDPWAEQLVDLVVNAAGWTGNDLRPLVYTVAELIDHRTEPVLRAVETDGLTVAGTRSWLTRTLRKAR